MKAVPQLALVGLLALPLSRALAPAVRIPSAVAPRPALALRPAPRCAAAPARCAELRLSASPPAPGFRYVNSNMVLQLILSQSLVFVLATALSAGGTFQVWADNDAIGFPQAPLVGALAVLPLLALNQALESSEAPVLAPMNLSTDLLVLSMFGSRSEPAVAFFVSLGLCLLVGLVEETVFRGVLLPFLSGGGETVGMNASTSAVFGAVLSSLIFGLGHCNVRGGLAGLLEAETFTLFLLQSLGGAFWAAVYLATGDLAVPVAGHALYDLVIFFGTHLRLTSQRSYAFRGIDEEKLKTDPRERLKLVFYTMDTNRDGKISRKELRIGLYSFGVVVPRDWSRMLLAKSDEDRSGQLDFTEFMNFVDDNDATVSKAIKRSVLGVRQ